MVTKEKVITQKKVKSERDMEDPLELETNQIGWLRFDRRFPPACIERFFQSRAALTFVSNRLGSALPRSGTKFRSFAR
ncbi:hypothetical protein RBSH_01454 [Rhodopirellula baltica SH28]|uniref:Uncharacterized protein n=1 Tax=Rhodopirellula baltica SH28 TaxID=993517 RepID=K5DJV8_RHOBT|nr:hypothetical protein RBSH_01454 [Rhodopirellula baltica SH28]